MECVTCNKKLIGKQRKFCSKRCKGRDFHNNQTNMSAQRKRAFDRKRLLMDQKGGKCEMCGYNTNTAALCFHHVNPNDKSFQLDRRNLICRGFASIQLEADKCKLLCANCHHETHNTDKIFLLETYAKM